MATATLHYEGWFQCRLATDPDDFDEPRGQSGWTFALPGEPDLDRIIRFQQPISPRSHGPTVGVFVTQVELDGQSQDRHPLIGGAVELADKPVFEGRNGAVASSAHEPVIPFRILIAQANIFLNGFDPVNNQQEIERRKPSNLVSNSQAALQASGVIDPTAYREARLARVSADLQTAIDPVLREGLLLRRDELQLGSIRRTSLAFQLNYRFQVRGANQLDDPDNTLGLGAAANTLPWAVEYWMGAWDADALCGYTKGTLFLG